MDLEIFTSKTIWERHQSMCRQSLFQLLLKMGYRAQTTAGSDERQRGRMHKASLRQELSQKALKHVSCYYCMGKCYFSLISQKGILWVGCISLMYLIRMHSIQLGLDLGI